MKFLKQLKRTSNKLQNFDRYFSGQIIDIRAFKAIDFLSTFLVKSQGPFSILDLGCSGGPTNAWSRNWENYLWIGLDSQTSAIEHLKAILPSRSKLIEGYIFSDKHCNHPRVLGKSMIEIENFVNENRFDFVKIDIDGCDLHILRGLLKSPGSESILGIEIEVTYSTFRDSEINFAECATILIEHGFEPVAIESARRYSNGPVSSPYVWDIEAQTAMGKVFQGNQTWVKRNSPGDWRSQICISLILAAYGLSDWSWSVIADLTINSTEVDLSIPVPELRNLFVPGFLNIDSISELDAAMNSGFPYTGKYQAWRNQAQNREFEQPWFLSN